MKLNTFITRKDIYVIDTKELLKLRLWINLELAKRKKVDKSLSYFTRNKL